MADVSQSCDGSVDFLLSSEKYFLVFIKTKIPILHLKAIPWKKKKGITIIAWKANIFWDMQWLFFSLLNKVTPKVEYWMLFKCVEGRKL